MDVPLPPNEAQLTKAQRIALKRIGQLLKDHFHRGMVTVVYKGEDQRLHVQMISNCLDEREQLDLARRALQQVERASNKIITTISPEERRQFDGQS